MWTTGTLAHLLRCQRQTERPDLLLCHTSGWFRLFSPRELRTPEEDLRGRDQCESGESIIFFSWWTNVYCVSVPLAGEADLAWTSRLPVPVLLTKCTTLLGVSPSSFTAAVLSSVALAAVRMPLPRAQKCLIHPGCSLHCLCHDLRGHDRCCCRGHYRCGRCHHGHCSRCHPHKACGQVTVILGEFSD